MPKASDPKGIAAEDAIRVAWDAHPGVRAISRAQCGSANDFLYPGSVPNGDRQVWAVYVTGVFPPPSSGPGPSPRSSDNQSRRRLRPARTALVLVDYVTGKRLMTQFPAPGGLPGRDVGA
jgi:hypothetical protein